MKENISKARMEIKSNMQVCLVFFLKSPLSKGGEKFQKHGSQSFSLSFLFPDLQLKSKMMKVRSLPVL